MLTAEDKAIRKTGIGGSDLAALFGLSNYRKPIDVWLEKTGQLADTEEEDTFAQSVGKVLESVICKEWQRNHPELMYVGPWPSTKHPDRTWHAFSLDGLGLSHETPVGSTDLQDMVRRGWVDRVVEAKSAGEWASKGYGDEGTDQIPYAHILQTQWYQSGLDVNRADVCVALNTNDYREYVIERDTELEGYLLTEVENFWKNHVLANVAPPPDGSPQFNEYIRGRFEKTRGEFLESTKATDALTLDLMEARQKAKELKEIDEVLSQKLKLAIGDADGIHTEYGKVTFKFHQQGKTKPKDVIEEMTKRLIGAGICTADSIKAIEDETRGDIPRVMRLPTNRKA